ncbi:hypothetical protein [Aeromonas veronii]|uniref:hypothetical protein n=1 Tax=Aeromonas veronii TaxID=654 RepID=UPI003D258E90
MAIKVVITKVLPLGGAAGVQSSETKIVLAQTNGIYDAFVQANKDEVTKLTKEVREAHTHIHADKEAVFYSREVVELARQEVQANQYIVAADKLIVATDKETVRVDREAVANDKAIVSNKRQEVGDLAEQVTADRDTAITQAGIATTQAGIAKSEADRAKAIADGINILGGVVDGNLTVTGTITEGGQALSDKYASPAFVLAQVEELKGGASGAYDTLKEIEEALKANDGDIGTITTALETKLSKSGGVMTGPVMFNDSKKFISFNGNDTWVAAQEGAVVLESAVNPMAAVGGHTHTIYHTGFKPTWADVGGAALIINDGSTSHPTLTHWLCAAPSLGFIPDSPSFSGRCSIGTNDWRFAQSFVANAYSYAVNVQSPDLVNTTTMVNEGGNLVFYV